MGRESDLNRADSSGNVWIIGHRPSEGGNAMYGQVDFVIQPASSLTAEELADEA